MVNCCLAGPNRLIQPFQESLQMSDKRLFHFHRKRELRKIHRACRGESVGVGSSLRRGVRSAAIFLGVIGAMFALPSHSFAQKLSIVSSQDVQGVVRDLAPGEMTIVDSDGVAHSVKIQNKGESAVVLGGTRVRLPAKIRVFGSLPSDLIEQGMIVRAQVLSNRNGRIQGEVSQLQLIEEDGTKLDHQFETEPESGKDYQPCQLTGRIDGLNRNKVRLAIPDSDLSRKGWVSFKLADDAKLLIDEDRLDRVAGGDKVVRAKIVKMSTGESAVRDIEIELTSDRQQATNSFHDQLAQRFSSLSDEPMPPRELRSDHFLLYTDLSDRSAQILMAKLEVMYDLVSQYFRKAPRQPVICYVVRDLSQWADRGLAPLGVAKIAERAGVTLTRTQRSRGLVESVVYSCEDHDICQHEAVHAFCALTFGSAGPVWYAEGMAEMGQYWKPDQLAVDINPHVIRYLQEAKPKRMADIVAAGQITGDSWQAYAWRWALCHLLANNPNYAKRFKQLGLNLMSDRNDDSFDNAFGPVAPNISFEYDQFVQNFGNGYRVDLCVWDWNTSAKKLGSSGHAKAKVFARAGWQATRVWIKEGQSFDHVAEGSWGIGKGSEDLSADGNSDGEGQLIGVLLNDFKLSKPFVLGKKKTWVAPGEGQLYLRCRDGWTELADNSGELSVAIRKTPAEGKE